MTGDLDENKEMFAFKIQISYFFVIVRKKLERLERLE